jgi:hypothetical protein
MRLWPHSPQNLNWAGFEELQAGHIFSSFAPHSPQNFMLSGFSNRHFEHFIFPVSTISEFNFE